MERMGKEFRLNNVSVERHAAKMLGVDRCSDVIRNHRRATSRSRDRHDALERRTTDPSRYSVMSVANAKLAGNQEGARGAAVRAQFARIAPRGGGPSSPATRRAGATGGILQCRRTSCSRVQSAAALRAWRRAGATRRPVPEAHRVQRRVRGGFCRFCRRNVGRKP